MRAFVGFITPLHLYSLKFYTSLVDSAFGSRYHQCSLTFQLIVFEKLRMRMFRELRVFIFMSRIRLVSLEVLNEPGVRSIFVCF